MGLEHWNGALVRWGDTAKIGAAPDQLFWPQEASSKLFWPQVLSFRIHSVADVGEVDRYWHGGERERTERGGGWFGRRGGGYMESQNESLKV